MAPEIHIFNSFAFLDKMVVTLYLWQSLTKQPICHWSCLIFLVWPKSSPHIIPLLTLLM